jgi:hypothetical protein
MRMMRRAACFDRRQPVGLSIAWQRMLSFPVEMLTNFPITSESPTEMAFINEAPSALFCSVLMGHLIRTSSKVAIVSENYEFDDRFRHVTRESIVQRL